MLLGSKIKMLGINSEILSLVEITAGLACLSTSVLCVCNSKALLLTPMQEQVSSGGGLIALPLLLFSG